MAVAIGMARTVGGLGGRQRPCYSPEGWPDMTPRDSPLLVRVGKSEQPAQRERETERDREKERERNREFQVLQIERAGASHPLIVPTSYSPTHRFMISSPSLLPFFPF